MTTTLPGAADLYPKVAHVIPSVEWATMAEDVDAIQRLKRERNAYRQALIQRDQAQRAYELTRDRIGLEVRDQLRQLQSVDQQIEIQVAQITQEERAVTVTEIVHHRDRGCLFTVTGSGFFTKVCRVDTKNLGLLYSNANIFRFIMYIRNLI